MLLMGKSTISMAMFNSYVKLPEGIYGIEMRYLWFLYGDTVDGCEILHHQTDGWKVETL